MCLSPRFAPSRGFPPAVGLAMSACESGWWASVTGANDYFGITRPRLSRAIRKALGARPRSSLHQPG
jgi:hypothetical protein